MRREKVKLNVLLRDDKASMEININTDQRTIAGVILSAEELDRVMAGLADIRSKMTPEVPREFPQGQPIPVHCATGYRLGFDPESKTVCLSFRSLAFGWLTFPIETREVERMYSHLQELKARPAAPHSEKKH